MLRSLPPSINIRVRCLVDDGVDHVQVSTRPWHVRQLVRAIEGDGFLGPPNELRRGRFYDEDLASLDLEGSPSPTRFKTRNDHEPTLMLVKVPSSSSLSSSSSVSSDPGRGALFCCEF